MVSTWRYPSFKDVHLTGPRSPLTLILFGALIYLIWFYSQPVLLGLASVYMLSGIVHARRRRHSPPLPSSSTAAATAAPSQLKMHSHRTTEKPTIAIVGGESLLGKEVRESLEAGKLPARIQSIASSEEGDDTKILTREDDEAVVMTTLHASDLEAARVVVLAGSSDGNKKAFEQLQKLKPATVIDMSGGLEDHPATRLRAPMVEPPGQSKAGEVQVIAHPAAIALALFLTRLRKAAAISRTVADIFQPASEFGQAGITELQKQTVSLLSFKPLPRKLSTRR